MNKLVKFQKNSKDMIINFENVSSIYNDKERNKIIINFNYSIKLKNKIIPDYLYINYETSEEEKNILDKIQLITNNWIKNRDRFVNPKMVSSIKFDDKRNRIIVNLNYTISAKDNEGNMILTSDFSYIDFEIKDLYEIEKERIIKNSVEI